MTTCTSRAAQRGWAGDRLSNGAACSEQRNRYADESEAQGFHMITVNAHGAPVSGLIELMIADGVELGFYCPRDALKSTYHGEARSSRAAATRRAICLAARRGGRSCPDAGASRSKSPLCLSDRDSNSSRLRCCCINLSLGLLLKLAVVCWARRSESSLPRTLLAHF